MSDIWKGTISAILGAIVAGCFNYSITIKNIEFNKQDSEYKQLFPLKFKAYNDFKKAMYDLELLSISAKKFNQNISDYDAYTNNFSTSLAEIETLITNISSIKKAKLINQNDKDTLFLSSRKWLYLYNQLLQLTFCEIPNEQNQKFILEEIKPKLEIISLEYQDYLYQLLFKGKPYSQLEINSIIDNLDDILYTIHIYRGSDPL